MRQPPDEIQPLIRARGLTKRFGAFTAVDGIDFEVAPGEAFGFLGPNGAGKTSTMRMIGTVSPVTAGELTIFGLDPKHHGPSIRARLGVVPQADTFVQLTERANDKVEPLSGGMKRRLVIARSLINEPALLLLDEPTTGLDPQARHHVWDRLYRLKQRGVTLCLTTHYMDEAEQLCDRLVVMDCARIVAHGSPRELIERYTTREVLELRFRRAEGETDDSAHLNGQLDGLADRVEQLPDRVLVYTSDGEAVAAAAYERGLRPASTLVRRSTLEDVFLRLTGRSLVE
jgi:lipooligosaccharide transport system ATP-binding protein